MSDISLQSRYKKAEQIITRKIASEVVLVPIAGDIADMQKLFTLNELGALVWNALDGQTPLQDIVASTIRSFDVTEPQAREDVTDFVDQLLNQALVVEVQ